MKLFYFYIGGRTAHSLVELHDVRFACGQKLEDCFDQLRQSWWGVPDSLHLEETATPRPVDFEIGYWMIGRPDMKKSVLKKNPTGPVVI